MRPPEKNAVVAPLSLTILLGAIETNSWRKETREQLSAGLWLGKRHNSPVSPAK